MRKLEKIDFSEALSMLRLDPSALNFLKMLGKGAKFVPVGSQIVGRKELRFGADNRR